MDAFCALNAPAPLLSILEADIVLAVRLPREILITSGMGVMNRITRHRARRLRVGGLGMGGGAAVGVRSWMPDYFRVVG
jgi:pantothenate kinase